MPKHKKTQLRSEKMSQNDRKILFNNAKNYISQARQLCQLIQNSEVDTSSQHYIEKLLKISNKCSEIINKYFKTRKDKKSKQDGMLKQIQQQLLTGKVNSEGLSENECKWLENIDELAKEIIDQFLTGEIEPITVEEIKKTAMDFSNNLHQAENSFKELEDRDKIIDFSAEVRKITIATGIICADGLAFYQGETFFSDSIWLGAGLFISVADKLLENYAQDK